MNGMINECIYRTPCGWCSKWDKHCDNKEGHEPHIAKRVTHKATLQRRATCPTCKEGKWILKSHGIETFYHCSVCDFQHQMNKTPFCSNCGAIMNDKEREDDVK